LSERDFHGAAGSGRVRELLRLGGFRGWGGRSCWGGFGGSGSVFRFRWWGSGTGGSAFIEFGEDFGAEVDGVLAVEEEGDAGGADAGFVEDEVVVIAFGFFFDALADVFEEAFAHAHDLFLELGFAAAAELVDFAFEGLGFLGDFLSFLGFLLFQFFVDELVLEELLGFIPLGDEVPVFGAAVVEFLFGLGFVFVDLLFGVLGFEVFLEDPLHVDDADFHVGGLRRGGEGTGGEGCDGGEQGELTDCHAEIGWKEEKGDGAGAERPLHGIERSAGRRCVQAERSA